MVDTVANMTMAVGSFGSAGSGFPSWIGMVIIIGFLGIVISFLISALASFQYYKKFKGFIRWCFKTVHYFFVGVGTLLVLAIPTGIVYYAITQARDGNVVPFKVTGFIIGGYFLIALIGWIAEKFVIKRVSSFENKLKKEKKQNG